LRVPLVILVLLFVGSGDARADLWYESYDRAIVALEDENWSEAVNQINRALESKGDSSARARTFGLNFTAYFPYFKLGVAYYHLGELDAALQAFETEERLGAIREFPQDYHDLQSFRRRVLEEIEASVEDRGARIEEIVRQGLADARLLDEKGDLAAAVAAVGKAISVDPQNADALALLEQLQVEMAASEEQAELTRRLQSLVTDGRRLMAAGEHEKASSRFRVALSLGPDREVEALLQDVPSSCVDCTPAALVEVDDGDGPAGASTSVRDGRVILA
jgi:tetratricopeptide (TPR) repeat protein